MESLAGKLLGLTLAAIVAGNVLIFAPALATFHETWLRERMNLSQIAALALEGSPDLAIAESLEYELLDNAGVLRAALQREGERVLLLESLKPRPLARSDHVRLYARSNAAVLRAFETWFAPDGRAAARAARA